MERFILNNNTKKRKRTERKNLLFILFYFLLNINRKINNIKFFLIRFVYRNVKFDERNYVKFIEYILI